MRPPEMLSEEVTKADGGEGEVNWSHGLYLTPDVVEKCFGARGLPRPDGIGPNQPFPHSGVYRHAAATPLVRAGHIQRVVNDVIPVQDHGGRVWHSVSRVIKASAFRGARTKRSIASHIPRDRRVLHRELGGDGISTTLQGELQPATPAPRVIIAESCQGD